MKSVVAAKKRILKPDNYVTVKERKLLTSHVQLWFQNFPKTDTKQFLTSFLYYYHLR